MPDWQHVTNGLAGIVAALTECGVISLSLDFGTLLILDNSR